MRKLHLNMVLALMVMTVGLFEAGTIAKAETESISWSVTYTGSKLESTYDSSKATITDTLPGDTIEYSVDYINGSSSAANFYMSADAVKTLEEGATATGGAYSYKITYTGSDEPLFDSETIGGDSDDSVDSVIGLNQVNGNEDSYFSLGSVAAGESGTVTVSITLDGNSQTNNYMDTLAELEIKFGAEPTSESEGDSIINHSSVVKNIVNTISGETEIVVIDDDDIPTTVSGDPKTGDSVLPLVICGIALIIGLLLILWYFKLTKENKEVA